MMGGEDENNSSRLRLCSSQRPMLSGFCRQRSCSGGFIRACGRISLRARQAPHLGGRRAASMRLAFGVFAVAAGQADEEIAEAAAEGGDAHRSH